MQDVSNIGGQQNHSQAADNGSTVFRHHGAQQAEHTDGRKFQNHVDALHKDQIQLFHSGLDGTDLIAQQQQSEPHNQSHNNQLEHIGAGHRSDKVRGKDIHNGIHNGNGSGSFIGKVGGSPHGKHALKKGANAQTDGDGESRIMRYRPKAFLRDTSTGRAGGFRSQ